MELVSFYELVSCYHFLSSCMYHLVNIILCLVILTCKQSGNRVAPHRRQKYWRQMYRRQKYWRQSEQLAPNWHQKYWRQFGARLAPKVLAPKVLAPKFPIGANWRRLAAGSPRSSKGTNRRLAAAPITANYWRLNKIGDRQSAPIGANRRQNDRQSAPKWRRFGAKLAVVRNRQLLAPIGANVPKNPVKLGLYLRHLAPFGANKVRPTRSSILPKSRAKKEGATCPSDMDNGTGHM